MDEWIHALEILLLQEVFVCLAKGDNVPVILVDNQRINHRNYIWSFHSIYLIASSLMIVEASPTSSWLDVVNQLQE